VRSGLQLLRQFYAWLAPEAYKQRARDQTSSGTWILRTATLVLGAAGAVIGGAVGGAWRLRRDDRRLSSARELAPWSTGCGWEWSRSLLRRR